MFLDCPSVRFSSDPSPAGGHKGPAAGGRENGVVKSRAGDRIGSPAEGWWPIHVVCLPIGSDFCG
jgi:hypothetical protein